MHVLDFFGEAGLNSLNSLHMKRTCPSTRPIAKAHPAPRLFPFARPFPRGFSAREPAPTPGLRSHEPWFAGDVALFAGSEHGRGHDEVRVRGDAAWR